MKFILYGLVFLYVLLLSTISLIIDAYYVILFIFGFLPLLNRISFWLYTIQLKEYRYDRFSEYLGTYQGKSALFNFWTVLEIPLIFFSLLIFVNPPFEYIMANVIYVFLALENIYVIRKVITGKVLRPKLTFRLSITLLLLISFILYLFYIILFLGYGNWIYFYILSLLVFSPILIFICILITLPLIIYLKNKKIKKAIEISHLNKNTVKIGITGSYGKSSVKEFLSSILEQDGKTLKTPENINTELGVSSLIINKLDETYKYFVAEMGAYKIGEINILGNITNHKYGILTAIGNQHLGLFGTQANIKTGKSEIANNILKQNGTLYINWDDKLIQEIEFDKKLKIVRYGNSNGCDAYYSIHSLKQGITLFNFKYKNIDKDFSTNLFGKHNILNLTGVLALCIDLGLDIEKIEKYLENIKVPKNTLHIIKKDNFVLIDDTYNLSEDGLYAGLDAINSFSGEKILVMDDILELGKEAENIHYVVGKYIASKYLIEKIFFCGVNYTNSFTKGLLDGGYDKKNILKKLDKITPGSVVLFEGRGSKKILDKFK